MLRDHQRRLHQQATPLKVSPNLLCLSLLLRLRQSNTDVYFWKFCPCQTGKIEADSTSEQITIGFRDHRSQIGFCVRHDLCFVSLTSGRLQDQSSATREDCNEHADQQPRNTCHSSQWAESATIRPDCVCSERIDYAIATVHSIVGWTILLRLSAQRGTEHTRISAHPWLISRNHFILLYKLRFGIIPLLHIISPSTCLGNLHNSIRIKHSTFHSCDAPWYDIVRIRYFYTWRFLACSSMIPLSRAMVVIPDLPIVSS